MAKYIIAFVYMCILLLAGTVLLDRRYHKEEQHSFIDCLKENKKYLVGMCFIGVVAIAVSIKAYMNRDEVMLEVLLRWLTILCGCYIITWIDYKEHIIPNKILLGLLIMRIIFMGYECIYADGMFQYFVWYPLFGALVGGISMLIGMLISRNGIGMGDVKFFFVIGLYVGSYRIISTLIYTFIISAIVGIGLVLSKKLTWHDAIPLAPFAFGGVFIEFVLMMIGG